MNSSMKLAFAGVLAGFFTTAPVSEASVTITHTAGAADWTFFYDEDNDRFDVVFRTKGNTVATGLTSPYAGPPGGVGGSANDHNFDVLQVNVSSAPTVMMNGIGYLVTPAAGQAYNTADQPDLGFRTRLREAEGAGVIDQFDAFRMSLDWAASTKPAGADFILFNFDTDDNAVVNIETSAGNLSHDWPVFGHSHWHFGFSQPGDYTLAFNVQGIGGHAGDSAVQQATLNFNVVPEPTTAFLATALLGMCAIRRRR